MKHYKHFYKVYPLYAKFDNLLYMCVEDNKHFIVFNEFNNSMHCHMTREQAENYMYETSNEYGFCTESPAECMEYLKVF